MAADMIHPLEPHGVHITCTSLDIVGDIHGCMTELEDLLEQLDWHRDGPLWSHPDRLLVLVGDLVNRGPASWRVLEFAHAMQQAGRMVCVLGNHDSMLLRALNGEHMPWFPAIANTLQQRETLAQPELQSRRAIAMLRQTPLWATFGSLSSPELVVVHACWHPRIADIPEHLHEPMCVYGPVVTDGSIRPKRLDWRLHYPEDAPFCIHGHTAYDGPIHTVRNTMCIDTGCVFGGQLTALRWPEREVVQVSAHDTWSRYPNIPSAPPLFDPEQLVLNEPVVWPWEHI